MTTADAKTIARYEIVSRYLSNQTEKNWQTMLTEISKHEPVEAKPISEWHEEDGNVLWWSFPIEEGPYAGTPLDENFPEDYYTHWTPIFCPIPPQNDDTICHSCGSPYTKEMMDGGRCTHCYTSIH